MRRRIFGLVLAGGLLLAGSASASCRWVSIWDSRTMQYRFEQHCTDDVVVAPGDSFLDALDGINRDRNRRENTRL